MKQILASALILCALLVPAKASAFPDVISKWAWDYTMHAFCDLCSGCVCSGAPNPYELP